MTTAAGTVMLAVAEDATLRRHAGVLEALAAQHGLSNLRLGTAPGEIVVTVGRGRDGFDMADFEIEAENVVRLSSWSPATGCLERATAVGSGGG